MKKKTIPLCSALAIFFTLSYAVFGSAQATVMRVSPDDQTVTTQENFTIEVTIDPETAIAGAQCNLRFDPSLLTVVSVEEGNLFSQGGAGTYFKDPEINNETGIVSGIAGVILGPNTVFSSGTLAIIHMRAKLTKGASELVLENVKIVDQNGEAVAITAQSGSVTISGHPPEDGGISPIIIIAVIGLVILAIVTVSLLTSKREEWKR